VDVFVELIGFTVTFPHFFHVHANRIAWGMRDVKRKSICVSLH
jgi:hypothetical protein